MTTAATTCLSSNVSIIEIGAPGIVGGVKQESASTTAVTIRKVRIGRPVAPEERRS